jgi:hypothetical protein
LSLGLSLAGRTNSSEQGQSMHTTAAFPVFVIAAALTALSVAAAPALAQTSTNIPTNAYHDDPLTADEKQAIAEEEAVTPDDGKPSVPAPQDLGVIPDAAVPLPSNKAATQGEKPGQKKTAESEADIILDDAKKNFPVTSKDLAECMKDWDPQTQMSKSEWAASCRTTLQYFPEKD